MLLKKEMRFLVEPTASYLQTVDDPVPEGLQRFLHNIICGQNSVQPSERTNRLVSSIGQDIYRATTRVCGNYQST